MEKLKIEKRKKKGSGRQNSNRDLLRENKETYQWATNQFVISMSVWPIYSMNFPVLI
jgi:hypothetical protein